MKIVGEFNYRNARAILSATHEGLVEEVVSILGASGMTIDLTSSGSQRNLSAQVAKYFVPHGWQAEQPVFTVPDLRYDLLKQNVPMELELGHQRLVYADFFKFLADYSQSKIPAGIMIVTGRPEHFGHNWHNSLTSTKKKLEAVSTALLVPILVLAVDS